MNNSNPKGRNFSLHFLCVRIVLLSLYAVQIKISGTCHENVTDPYIYIYIYIQRMPM
jgi:hypothetical protein